MLSLETVLRLMVIGQDLLIAVIFLFGLGNRNVRISAALLLLCKSSYLLTSDAVLRDTISFVLPVTTLLAMIVPYSLWLFARAVFEAPWPRARVVGGFIALIVTAWIVVVNAENFGAGWFSAANTILRITSLGVVIHALLITARGRPDDLIEHRRKFRVYFIAIVAIQVVIILSVELLLGSNMPPALNLVNVIVIAIMTLALSIPLLRLNKDFFRPVVQPESDATPEADNLSAAESVLKGALLDSMDDGGYRQSGLTISALADQLGYPEHQLRKLINSRLGFRNFSAFLNSYRIPAAKQLLSDPASVRTPVLTIALDLGYGSLGPFNRAFKASTDMTPTEFREMQLKSKPAETE